MSDEPSKAQENVRDFILAERAKGNLVVLGIEGLMSMSLEEFVKQPADGMLYDLNRSEEVSMTFLHERKWVNDFAVALVIRKLVEQRDSRSEAVERDARDDVIELIYEIVGAPKDAPYGDLPGYVRDAITEADQRDAVLEEAAKVCEGRKVNFALYAMSFEALQNAADAIRALKRQSATEDK